MPVLPTAQAAQQNTQSVLDAILHALQALKNGSGFGSIEIVMHDGRVTQIERREKLRIHHDTANLNNR